MTVKKNRIFLSPPHMGGRELDFVREAFESNYIAPLGPQVDAFERAFTDYTSIPHCVALSSGTAAMHLALRILGVGPGDDPGEMCFSPHWHEFYGVKALGAGDQKTNDKNNKRPLVLASSLTFIGSVTPAIFEGYDITFIDSERESWNMDPELLEQELHECKNRGRAPKAVIPTDLYGQCCDLPRLLEICDRYGVPVVCDSAEAMGAKYQRSEDRGQKAAAGRLRTENGRRKTEDVALKNQGMIRMDGGVDERSEIRNLKSEIWRHAGVGTRAAVFSFNGNKIMTTSGGGMLASDDKALIDHARFLSQQARDPFPHYEHTEIGYNYRMSNILAAIGRGQLTILDERVKRKREIFEYYKAALGHVPGIEFMPEPEWSRSNRWLTVILITPSEFGADREQVRMALEEENIEARPVWKPMHMQPVFRVEGLKAQGPRFKGYQRNRTYKARVVGGEVAEDLFNRGLCLPSGTAMANPDLDRVINTILKSATNARRCIQTHKSKTLHMDINDITYRINGAVYEVNRVLGGGFLEKGHPVK